MTSDLADLFTDECTLSDEVCSRHTANNPACILHDPEDEVDRLRRALTEALDAYTDAMGGHRQPLAPNRFRALRELAAPACTPDEYVEPFERGMEGSARAAAKWTPEEVAQVDAAIRTIVERLRAKQRDTIARHRAANYRVTNEAFPQEFTTAAVWAELGDGFPVTKGIAGRMIAAKGAGLIESTGRTTYPPKDAPGPNAGQRLTVWRALP